jgi:periplasmic protein TonB
MPMPKAAQPVMLPNAFRMTGLMHMQLHLFKRSSNTSIHAGARQLARFKVGLAAVLLGASAAAQAQFSMVPAPLCPAPKASAQDVEQEFRIDAARHLYACYPMRVYRGKLPPLLYGIAIIEIELDAQGNVLAAEITRKPAADEVAPWLLAMIRRAAPYPAPARFPEGKLRFKETFFVDKSGLFQTFTLTEGQR